MAGKGKGNPRMVTGLRAEDTFPERDGEGPDASALPRLPARAADLPKLPEGKRRFQAEAPGYRLQLSCSDDIIVQGVGKIPGRSVAIQFVGGFYETDDPAVIAQIEKSKSYGIGKSVWDADELRAAAEDKQYETFMEQLGSNPRLKERLAVDPRLKDFSLEAAPAGA